MKPYQEIDTAVKDVRNEIQKIADAFNERTGGVITSIAIDFVEITEYGSETKKTIVGNVGINTAH